MEVLLAGVVLLVPLAGYGGWWWAKRSDRVAVPKGTEPPGTLAGKYLVVARTDSGARARQMWERGACGPGESLELWDGNTCRGRKGAALKEG